MDGFSTVGERLTAKEFAYTEIKKQIIEGKLEPDIAIIEETLATNLEISRTPLREALQRLEQEDLVIRQNNGRLKVAPLSIQEVKELFEVRAKLESIMVMQATENMTDKDANKLTMIVNMIKETAKIGDVQDVLHYGTEFHGFIYALSRNKTVNKILSQLNDRIHRYQHLLPKNGIERFQSSHKEHQIILDYMKNGNKKSAQMAMESHIENSLDAVVHAIWNQHQQTNKEGEKRNGE
ncbi:MAG TPA: GntR family transcriptional regulator [Bacillota bacterium]|nr:GntR family transcriptional regulator [Bacillota bacterium]